MTSAISFIQWRMTMMTSEVMVPDDGPKTVAEFTYELWVQNGRNAKKTSAQLAEADGERPAIILTPSQINSLAYKNDWRTRQYDEAVKAAPEMFALTREIVHRIAPASAVFIQDVIEGKIQGDPRQIKNRLDAAKHALGMAGHTIRTTIDLNVDGPQAPMKDFKREIADMTRDEIREYVFKTAFGGDIIDVEVVEVNGDDSGASSPPGDSSGSERSSGLANLAP
jgi:hypothetical protein